MASAAPSTAKHYAPKVARKVGRSVATGMIVLAPASKVRKITVAKARSAANIVYSSKK